MQTAEPAPPNAAELIVSRGQLIVDAYQRYQHLRGLAAALQGQPDSAPLPPELRVDNLTITYALGNGEEPTTVQVEGVARVGDLNRVVAHEIDRLINVMRTEAQAVRVAADMIEGVCANVRYMTDAQGAAVP